MSDTTVELLRLSLAISRVQQQTHMENIAGKHLNTQRGNTVDFGDVMEQLRAMNDAAKQRYISGLMLDWEASVARRTAIQPEALSLDNEVAKMNLVSGTYQRNVELLNRKLALMQLVVNGGRR